MTNSRSVRIAFVATDGTSAPEVFCHVTKAQLDETKSAVEITLSEPLLLLRSAQAPTFY